MLSYVPFHYTILNSLVLRFGNEKGYFLIAVLQTIFNIVHIFLFYLIGVLVYTNAYGFSVSGALQFITVTVTADELAMLSPSGKLFTIFYGSIGILYVLQFAKMVLAGWFSSYIHRYLELQYTTPQNKLRVVVFFYVAVIFAFVCIGVVFYVFNEDWTFVDSLWMTFQTVTTIGYGDLTVKYASTWDFTMIYLWIAVVLTIESYYSIRDCVLEAKSDNFRSFLLQLLAHQSEASESVDVNINRVNKLDIADAKNGKRISRINCGRLDEIKLNLLHDSDTIRTCAAILSKLSQCDQKSNDTKENESGTNSAIMEMEKAMDQLGSHDTLALRQLLIHWKQLSASEFYVMILLTLRTVNYHSHILPLKKFYEMHVGKETGDANECNDDSRSFALSSSFIDPSHSSMSSEHSTNTTSFVSSLSLSVEDDHFIHNPLPLPLPAMKKDNGSHLPFSSAIELT